MTEEKARTKECKVSNEKIKLLLSAILGILAEGKDSETFLYVDEIIKDDTDYCKASDCMMWRWNVKKENLGYCGPAGKE